MMRTRLSAAAEASWSGCFPVEGAHQRVEKHWLPRKRLDIRGIFLISMLRKVES